MRGVVEEIKEAIKIAFTNPISMGWILLCISWIGLMIAVLIK